MVYSLKRFNFCKLATKPFLSFKMKIFSFYILIALPLLVIAKPSPFIWGGTRAVDGQFPYQVFFKTTNDDPVCGGVILNSRWIVTAAHCLLLSEETELVAIMGSVNLEEGIKNPVIERFQHENYNYLYNDIGLVKVKNEIKFNENIQPIKISEENIGPDNEVIISGWGQTEFDYVSPFLMYINATTVSNEKCQEELEKVHPNFPIRIQAEHICAFASTGKGTCKGDSGGPLTYKNELIGLTAFGTVKCAIGAPDGFTRISVFKDWIEEKIKET